MLMILIYAAVFCVMMVSLVNSQNKFVPCQEISDELRFPCLCALGPIEEIRVGNLSLLVNCDNIVFPNDVPFIPFGAPVIYFSQKHVGHQSLPNQVFSSNLPVRILDLSYNSIRKLAERLFHNINSTIQELRLSHNLLGDTLNPIFSTNEFKDLKLLTLLDLSGNGIKAIEEGIFEGCINLMDLYLDNNDLKTIPGSSLRGPKFIKLLSLNSNNIEFIKINSFSSQKYLEILELSNNLIGTIESGAFTQLTKLITLNLSQNRFSKFNSDVFFGADNLQNLDLSKNFIVEFPTLALKVLKNLQSLNLSSNLLEVLDNTNLKSLPSLQVLDLSRNSLTNIVPGTFLGLKKLKFLDISVNSLRAVEDDAFEGLDNLEYLNIKDNNILLIPASALGRLPHLTNLHLDYNRIAALSGQILSSLANHITELVLANNVVRELPNGTFQYFHNLNYLDLRSNWISSIPSNTFQGLEFTLEHLYLSDNRIMTLPESSISLNALKTLDMSKNHLTELSKSSFAKMPYLRTLNLSHNFHLTKLPGTLLKDLNNLEVIDLSSCGLQGLSKEFFSYSTNLKKINLSYNKITEILDKSFVNMENLTSIDFSFNNISSIKQLAFVFIMNIRELNLRGNQLTSFKGEYFNTGTSLEILDISENQLSYLFPSSFRIHPRLKKILASKNKFNFFPAELITSLQFLELIDLSFNQLKSIEELDFARLPRLRSLLLSNNQLESLSEMAFHNTTQLQVLDLSNNKLDRLGERIFEGLIRLELLNLDNNELAELPDNIFERTRLQMLDNIILSRNKFTIAPLKALQRQYFYLNFMDLSDNKIEEIPDEDSIMVNVKKVDFSFNPLSEATLASILGEPKTIRSLNLAATGLNSLNNRLETPFLKSLNLSFNNITELSESVFERTTLLEELDLSNNRIVISDGDKAGLGGIFKFLKNLKSLNISNNSLEQILEQDFEHLTSLRFLAMNTLENCTKLEKSCFKHLVYLKELDLFNLPKLGYIDINGILQNMQLLEKVNIETKDAAIGKDQLQSTFHPRLRELGIRGLRLKSVSSGTFSGIKGPEIVLSFINTSLTSIQPALFFPLPKSSKITLDLIGNQLTTLSSLLLGTIEDRRGELQLKGLESNPIFCDCNTKTLRRWIQSYNIYVKCAGPIYLLDKLLNNLEDDDLTCDPEKINKLSAIMHTSTLAPLLSETTKFVRKKTTEMDIIWSMPPVSEKIQPKIKTSIATISSGGPSALNNDDTLIIGIVGGVVAFIAILIIIICIIRLKMSSSNHYGGGPVTSGSIVAPGMIGTGSSCACSIKGGPAGSVGTAMYAIPSSYATLPHKMAIQASGGMRIPPSAYSTMGRGPYTNYNNSQQPQPYFIAAYPTDEKSYR